MCDLHLQFYKVNTLPETESREVHFGAEEESGPDPAVAPTSDDDDEEKKSTTMRQKHMLR